MTLDSSSIAELTAEMAKAKAEFTEKGKAMFAEISKALFEKHPKLESFGWRQYTDYFNDGDTCTFSVHADPDWGLDINGESASEIENTQKETYQSTGQKVTVKRSSGWGENRKEWDEEIDEKKFLPNPNYDPVMGDMVNDVSEFLYGMPSEIMEDMFGDHVSVTVSKDGITIDEYTDHD
jgi:hypothetical protein